MSAPFGGCWRWRWRRGEQGNSTRTVSMQVVVVPCRTRGNEHAYHKAKAFKEVSMLDREGDHLLQLSLHVLQAANVIKGGARVLQQHTPQSQPQSQRHTQ